MGIPCPSVEQKLQLKKAIQRGDIIYHAFPFNSQIEFLGKELISFGINMTHELDNFFSIAPKTVLSQRDVPGFTVSAIPTLVSHNITGISIGVNPGSSPVHVPRDRPFLWKHRETNTSIIVTYHAGGYGSTSELTYYPGDSVGLFHAWRGDNEGPHDTQEVLNILADIRKRYPGISVESGSFDEYYAYIFHS